MTNVSIIYYSMTGTNRTMAQAVAEGARDAGAETRVRMVPELAPQEAIDANPAWKSLRDAVADEPSAASDDLLWADAVVFGSPTRFGNVASQLKAFIDSLGPLWFKGQLADKVYAGFTSAQNPHGGQESTLLALYNSVHHFGGYIVTPGYTDPLVFQSGGNPYGPSVTATGKGIDEADLNHAHFLGRRVAQVAGKLA